jgi:hypothetical protein
MVVPRPVLKFKPVAEDSDDMFEPIGGELRTEVNGVDFTTQPYMPDLFYSKVLEDREVDPMAVAEALFHSEGVPSVAPKVASFSEIPRARSSSLKETRNGRSDLKAALDNLFREEQRAKTAGGGTACRQASTLAQLMGSLSDSTPIEEASDDLVETEEAKTDEGGGDVISVGRFLISKVKEAGDGLAVEGQQETGVMRYENGV